MEQGLVIIPISPAVHHLVAKAAVPAEHTLVLMAVAGQENAVLPVRPILVGVLPVEEARAVPEEEANVRRDKSGLELVVIFLLDNGEVIVAVVMAWVVE